MRCPFCQADDDKVVDSRPAYEGAAVRRRRECLKCGHRFTTFEIVEKTPIVVVKRDGKREAFDRQKIVAGVLRACEKRPVTLEEVERVVQFVEKTLYNNMEREVSSLKIGEMVLKKLKELDEVATLLRPEDRVRLLAIDDTVQQVWTFRDPSSLDVTHLSHDGQSSLYDALATALIKLTLAILAATPVHAAVKVVTTTETLAWAVRTIGGSQVRVSSPPGDSTLTTSAPRSPSSMLA